MSLHVDPNILDDLARSSGAMYFTLQGADDGAIAAMRAAAAAVASVRHTDEPDEQLASFVSDISDSDRTTSFWADISDMEEEVEVLQAVRDAVIGALQAARVTGTLTAKPPESIVGVGRMAGVPFPPIGPKRKKWPAPGETQEQRNRR